MTTRKKNSNAEPFLSVVARKIGRAAGTITNVAQGFTENLTALPKAVSVKIEPAQRASSDRRRSNDTKNKTQSKPKARATATRTTKTARKRRPTTKKSVRASARPRKNK